ncbi:MAG: hypothetical protein JW819_02320 [Candidatus Krumholzibacteriota bacterium]|nr:hypothetical protein [Candidatus Krumholzibacteriota bacterium]
MANPSLLFMGAIGIIAWGLAHLFATKPVITGMGDLDRDHERILIMEWISGGFFLCFIGVVVLLAVLLVRPGDHSSAAICQASAIALLVHTVISLMSGAQTNLLPLKICPLVTGVAAALIFFGSLHP